MNTHKTAHAADGTPIAYDDFGPRDGVPVVLVHGLCASARQFADDAAYFAARGFRVLTPDVRGHGRSGRPASLDPALYTIPILADDMLAVLDHAGVGPVHWVGNSLGGIVALDLIGRVPERFRTLATFGTAHRLNLPRLAAAAIPLTYRLLGRNAAAGLTGWTTGHTDHARQVVREMIAAFEPAVGAAIAENVRRYDLTAAALAHQGPMLLLRGDKDHAVNRALAATLPRLAGMGNFRLVALPGGGHCANLDVPEAFRAALEAFWAETRAG